jgi:hypothetical protein
MEIRILGPAQVADGSSSELSIGGPQQRRVIGTDSILTVAPGYVLQESAQTFEAGRQSSSAAATSETAVIRFTAIDEGHANAWTL